MSARRLIDPGGDYCNGPRYTDKTPDQIAQSRSEQIESLSDRELFLTTFGRVRLVAVKAFNVDPEALWSLTKVSPVMEAAYIEALASLRAEGVSI